MSFKCTSIADIKVATEEDSELQVLKRYLIRGWPHTKDSSGVGVDKYWLIRHELTMIEGITLKGKHLFIPYLLQRHILQQLHCNYMSTEKTHLLARESVHWINMNANIKQTIKQCFTYLEYQSTQLYITALHCDIPHKT